MEDCVSYVGKFSCSPSVQAYWFPYEFDADLRDKSAIVF